MISGCSSSSRAILILEACRVVDRGRDEREVLVAHGKERSCDTVEGPVGEHERTWVQHESDRTSVVVLGVHANTISPSTRSEFLRESMTCFSTSWRPWVRRR